MKSGETKMKKIHGIVYAYDTEDEFEQVKDAGLFWIRINIGFPWKDRMHGELREQYLDAREEIRAAHAAGMKVMPATAPLGGWVYVPEKDETAWVDSFPAFVGEKGTDVYYENIRVAMEFTANDLKPFVEDLWQCMNEIDIPTFSNDYPLDVICNTARASAEGILRANPNAMCGINLSSYRPEAVVYADLVHQEPSPMRYIGIDQYFGSWQAGDISSWPPVIDALFERYAVPVLINEWGYSSAGRVITDGDKKPEHLKPEGWPDVCHNLAWFHEVEGGHTEETQAQYIRDGLTVFMQHPHVLGQFIFCWKDAKRCYHCGQEKCPAECFWGITRNDRSFKPAYFVVKELLTQ